LFTEQQKEKDIRKALEDFEKWPINMKVLLKDIQKKS
jgi:hypothetical protein